MSKDTDPALTCVSLKPRCNMTRETALEVAARVWCDQEMETYTMDVEAAKEIAEIIFFAVTKQDRVKNKESR